jgi:hypothetical protein
MLDFLLGYWLGAVTWNKGVPMTEGERQLVLGVLLVVLIVGVPTIVRAIRRALA